MKYKKSTIAFLRALLEYLNSMDVNDAFEKAMDDYGFDFDTDSESFVHEFLLPEIEENHKALWALEEELQEINKRITEMHEEQVNLIDTEIALGIFQNVLLKRWGEFEPIEIWRYKENKTSQKIEQDEGEGAE